jgi:hypothetical protein
VICLCERCSWARENACRESSCYDILWREAKTRDHELACASQSLREILDLVMCPVCGLLPKNCDGDCDAPDNEWSDTAENMYCLAREGYKDMYHLTDAQLDGILENRPCTPT